MAKKQAQVLKPEELYEEKVIYVVYYVDSSAFGKYVGKNNQRSQAVSLAEHFLDYDDAHSYILKNCMEGVAIEKVWV